MEEISVEPEILIINLEFGGKVSYKREDWIKVVDIDYKLKAINRYTDYHSTA